jgi:outer membrane immunogenic protein
MKFVLLAAASATVLGASPAAAADFTGPRLEGRIGYEWITLVLKLSDGVTSVAESGHKSGVNLGGEVGYDVALGSRAVIGAYAGIEGASAKACSEVNGNDQGCLTLGRNLTVGGRIGAKIADKVMVYAKGGYSNGQLRASYSDFSDPTFDFSDHVNRGGFHFGGGVEGQISPNTYARVEYVRTEYDEYAYGDADLELGLSGHRDQVVAGFGVRF